MHTHTYAYTHIYQQTPAIGHTTIGQFSGSWDVTHLPRPNFHNASGYIPVRHPHPHFFRDYPAGLSWYLQRMYHRCVVHTVRLCNTVQDNATHCDILQHVACVIAVSHTLQHTATQLNTPQHTATHRNTPQHPATHCNKESKARSKQPADSQSLFDCMCCWEVGGWGRDPFSRNFMNPTPRRKWYLTTGRRFHWMVLDPIPYSLPVHFFGSRPQPPTSRVVRQRGACTCVWHLTAA